jgi:hypothetical protein
MAGTFLKEKRRYLPFLPMSIPFILWLYPPFYNYVEPKFLDMPFFYWFQIIWVIITALVLAVIYLLER